MIRLATSKQCKEIDLITSKKYKISSLQLMEGAGAQASEIIFQKYYPQIKNGYVLILCGPGNNGGDGYVVARYLASKNIKVKIYSLPLKSKPTNSFQKNICKKLELHIVKNISQLKPNLVIDAMFGIGFSKPLNKSTLSVIKKVNQLKCMRIALDVATGLNSDTGCIQQLSFKANLTICFGLLKPGYFLRQGPDVSGQIIQIPLTYPKKLIEKISNQFFLVDSMYIKNSLPKNDSNSNKSKNKKVGIFAGSKEKFGAALLSTKAAFKMGCGYVYLYEQDQNILKEFPDIILESKEFIYSNCDAFAIGPGFGVNSITSKIIKDLYKKNKNNVVLDADALTMIAKEKLPLLPSWILTPHSGELSRLINIDVKTIESDPLYYSQMASQKFNCVILFKGFHTIISYNDKSFIINSGNSSLAKAGSGDVLTGMIASLLAKGLNSIDASICGAFLHGHIADLWIQTKSKESLTASDLIEQINLINI